MFCANALSQCAIYCYHPKKTKTSSFFANSRSAHWDNWVIVWVVMSCSASACHVEAEHDMCRQQWLLCNLAWRSVGLVDNSNQRSSRPVSDASAIEKALGINKHIEMYLLMPGFPANVWNLCCDHTFSPTAGQSWCIEAHVGFLLTDFSNIGICIYTSIKWRLMGIVLWMTYGWWSLRRT